MLPKCVEDALRDFMVAGKNGHIELHIRDGNIETYKVVEVARVKR